MRLFFLAAVVIIVTVTGFSFSSCKSSGPPTFCDTSCVKDSMKFIKEEHPLKPYVYISANNCMADTIAWSYDGMGVNRKLSIEQAVGPNYLNKDFVRCFIYDTSYAWVLFNDCVSGQGFYLKIPFSRSKPINVKDGALNALDPRFAVADGLAAYTDRGNIFVEEMATGKKAMVTFGRDTNMDFMAIHQTLDSINITASRVWAKVKLGEDWKEIDSKITLE